MTDFSPADESLGTSYMSRILQATEEGLRPIIVSNFPHIVPPNFLNTVPLDFHDCVPVDFLDVVPRYLES